MFFFFPFFTEVPEPAHLPCVQHTGGHPLPPSFLPSCYLGYSSFILMIFFFFPFFTEVPEPAHLPRVQHTGGHPLPPSFLPSFLLPGVFFVHSDNFLFFPFFTQKYPNLPTYPVYSTLEDTLDYFSRYIDRDYNYTMALTQVVADVVLQLADGATLPLNITNYIGVLEQGAESLRQYETDFRNAGVKLGS